MDSDFGNIIVVVLGLIAIAFIIYCIIIMAGILISVAASAGVVWGGGTAIINYVKSFKENIIDSNRSAA